jgi:Surface antigen
MLSLDRNRKRRALSQRSRSRLNPPVLESIPRSMPGEQLPFPEYIYGTAASPYGHSFTNQSYASRYSSNMGMGPSGVARTPAMPYQGGYAGIVGSAGMYGGNYPSFRGYPAVPQGAPTTIRPSFPGTMAAPSYTTGTYSNPVWSATRQLTRLEAQDTERVSAIAANRLLRSPVIIRGTAHVPRQERMGLCPPAGRRAVVGGAVCILLLFVLLGCCMAVVPINGNSSLASLGALQPVLGSVSVPRNSNALISAEYATATAVTQDGYDPGNVHYHGMPVAPLNSHASASDAGNLSRFFYGQCTYWANMRYHQLTHHWIPWLGNAYQWAYEAPAYGWTISDVPNPHGPSIMVFSPYSVGSGSYGHVAVVEHTNPDGSVFTSNWNWDGQWATQSWLNFYPGSGISFIWFPDSSDS